MRFDASHTITLTLIDVEVTVILMLSGIVLHKQHMPPIACCSDRSTRLLMGRNTTIQLHYNVFQLNDLTRYEAKMQTRFEQFLCNEQEWPSRIVYGETAEGRIGLMQRQTAEITSHFSYLTVALEVQHCLVPLVLNLLAVCSDGKALAAGVKDYHVLVLGICPLVDVEATVQVQHFFGHR